MNRDAHLAVGVGGALAFAALPLSGPVTIPACLCAVAGGALGGWVPDIDNGHGGEDEAEVGWAAGSASWSRS